MNFVADRVWGIRLPTPSHKLDDCRRVKVLQVWTRPLSCPPDHDSGDKRSMQTFGP